jgi:hypothetical protein
VGTTTVAMLGANACGAVHCVFVLYVPNKAYVGELVEILESVVVPLGVYVAIYL